MTETLLLYDIQGNKVDKAKVEKGEVVFTNRRRRWVWILDARHEPYKDLPLKMVLSRAAGVRKRYALVNNTKNNTNNTKEIK